jgi:hypothetical protein
MTRGGWVVWAAAAWTLLKAAQAEFADKRLGELCALAVKTLGAARNQASPTQYDSDLAEAAMSFVMSAVTTHESLQVEFANSSFWRELVSTAGRRVHATIADTLEHYETGAHDWEDLVQVVLQALWPFEVRHCAHCGEEVRLDVAYCQRCGRKLQGLRGNTM